MTSSMRNRQPQASACGTKSRLQCGLWALAGSLSALARVSDRGACAPSAAHAGTAGAPLSDSCPCPYATAGFPVSDNRTSDVRWRSRAAPRGQYRPSRILAHIAMPTGRPRTACRLDTRRSCGPPSASPTRRCDPQTESVFSSKSFNAGTSSIDSASRLFSRQFRPTASATAPPLTPSCGHISPSNCRMSHH